MTHDKFYFFLKKVKIKFGGLKEVVLYLHRIKKRGSVSSVGLEHPDL
jgi:hypothetical protein